MPQQEAESMGSFLLSILNLDPTKRASAKACLDDPWLSGVPSITKNASCQQKGCS